MKCEVEGCDVSLETGGALFRVNAYGEPGRWRCEEHCETRPPADVLEITDIVVADNVRRKAGSAGEAGES